MTNLPTGAHVTVTFASALRGMARAGSPWRAPGGYIYEYNTSDTPPGMVTVDDGHGMVMFYAVSRRDAGAFRRWTEAQLGDLNYRLAGRFPSYEVVRRTGLGEEP